MNLRDLVKLKRINGDVVTEVDAVISGRSHPISKDLPHNARSAWVYDVRILATGEIVPGITDADLTLVREWRHSDSGYQQARMSSDMGWNPQVAHPLDPKVCASEPDFILIKDL